MDSSVSENHGHQEGSAYNGHFECTCYHPLFCFNQDGDLERALLRNGNVHSADDWRSVLEPVVARCRTTTVKKFFRGDAAFAIPELYVFLEAEHYGYAIRLKSNHLLEREIEHLLKRPAGRPPEKTIVWYHDFMYQAASLLLLLDQLIDVVRVVGPGGLEQPIGNSILRRARFLAVFGRPRFASAPVCFSWSLRS